MPLDNTPSSLPLIASQSLWKWALGLILLAALVWFVESQIGWRETLAAWQSISITSLLSATGLFVCSHLLRALRIFDFVFASRGATYLQVAKISALHQFANNLMPMRLGEFVLPLLTKRHFGHSLAQGLSHLLWLRLLDMALMGSVVYLLLATKFGLLPFLAIGICAALAGAAILWFLNSHIERYPLLAKIRDQIIKEAPQTMPVFIRLFLWTALAWFTKLCALAIIVQSLAQVGLVTALAGALGAELSSLLPIHGFAGTGSFEAAFSAGFALFGELSTAVVAVAVNLHIFVLSSTSLVTLVLLPVTLPTKKSTEL
ncbi:MAG: flippase-like domain-containing protein [Agarilytica sp.]